MPTTNAGDTRMTSFSDPSLSWSDAPPNSASEAAPPAADTSTTDATAAPSSAATTTPPADTTGAGEAPLATQGPIPFADHKRILEGERTKFAELDGKWQRVAWANTLMEAGKSPDEVREALTLFDEIRQTNPVNLLDEVYRHVSQNPEFAQEVRSWAGKVLSAGRTFAPQGPLATDREDIEPQPDYQDGQGQKFYSADQWQKALAWRERQMEAKFDARMAPLETHHQQQVRQAEEQRVLTTVRAQLESYRQKPGFREHEADVKAYMQAHQWRAPLAEAWAHVLETKILPHTKQTAGQEKLAELQTQAAASGIKPSGVAPTTPVRPKGFRDPSLKWE